MMDRLSRRGLLGGLIASCSAAALGQVWRPGMQPRFQPGLRLGGGQALRAVTARGQIPLASTATSGGRTRMDFRLKYVVRHAVTTIGASFVNQYFANSTRTDGVAVSIVALAVENGATVAPLPFGGSAAHVVPSGAVDDPTDIVSFAANVGDVVWLRGTVDLGASYVNAGKIYNTVFLEGAGLVDQCWVYDPANSGNTILATGAMSAPSGSAVAIPFAPANLIGYVGSGKRAVIGVGTSIEDGTLDFLSATGAAGGGQFRRAAALLGLPYCSHAVNGGSANHVVGNHSMLQGQLKYFTDYWCGHATNDIQSGSSLSQVQASLSAVWAYGKAAGLRVLQTMVLPRVTSTDRGTSMTQTPIWAFASNGVRDQVNAWLPSQLGSAIDILADNLTPVALAGDNHKWAIRPYSSTLAAAATSTATSVSLAALPVFGEFLVFDPGGANQSTGTSNAVYSTSGTGPYTASFFNSIGVAQASGATVKASYSQDGTHPQAPVYATLASAVAAAAA